MTESQIYTWIFLTLSEEPASLQDIIGSADAINHAIPTHQELQSAFGWLMAQGLVRKDGKKYAHTPEGAVLRKKSVGPKMTIRESWAAVEKKFEKMVGGSSALDDVTTEEIESAYEGYKRLFWQTYRKLSGKDRKPNKRPEGTEGKCPPSKHSQLPSVPHP